MELLGYFQFAHSWLLTSYQNMSLFHTFPSMPGEMDQPKLEWLQAGKFCVGQDMHLERITMASHSH